MELSLDASKKTFYAKWGRGILVVTLLFVPLAFFAAGKAVESNVNKIEDWLPKKFQETAELDWFRANFPTDQFIVVSWDGCKLGEASKDGGDDPRIARLTSLLMPREDAPETDDVRDARRYIKSVMSGREMLNQLTNPPVNLDYQQAINRLTGSLIGNDGRQTCLIVSLSSDAGKKLKAVLGRGQKRIFRPNIPPGILRRAIAECGVSEEILHIGGPPVDNVAIDEEGEKTLVRLAGAAAMIGLFLAWLSLRSILLTMVVFFCGILSAAVSLAVIWVTGETVDAIVLSMPSLVYVLAISESVHFINYYRDAVAEGGLIGAAERAVKHAFKPALLCSVTTALGLISLYTSDIVPIRKFGLYASIGVMVILFVLFLILPTILHLVRFGKKWERSKSSKEETSVDNERFSFSDRAWTMLGTTIVRNHIVVNTVCVAATIFVGIGLFKTSTSIDLLELFDSRARILQDYRWLEKHLGRLVPMEIVVRFDIDSMSQGDRNADSTAKDLYRLTFLERMETTLMIQDKIEKEFGSQGKDYVGRSLSASNFMPTFPSTMGDTISFIQRKAFESRLNTARDSLMKSGYLRVDSNDGSELWRISLRVGAFQGVDYGDFVHELREKVKPLMVAHHHRVKILEQLAHRSDDGRHSGKKVYLWERCNPESESASVQNETADVLDALLTTARVKVIRGNPDPASIPVVSLQNLNRLDAVVLLGDFAQIDSYTIHWAVENVIDLNQLNHDNPVWSLPTSTRWLSAVYTGVVPIVYKAQRALLDSLVQSTFWSFITITPLMMFVCKSWRAGIVTMLPNIVPVVGIFGAMGWLGIPIDIGSMMSASIALGIAVDDTIHYLAWFRVELDKLGDRKAAIIATYRGCATPTLQSALISGLGLSVFAFSSFTPTQRFGWLMLTILIAGVLAELVMLPAILASPLGRVFDFKSDGKCQDESEVAGPVRIHLPDNARQETHAA